MPQGLWWEHLESNFADRPEGFELEPRDWFRVNVAAGLDRVLRFYGGSLLTGTLPAGLLPEVGWDGLTFRETPADWAVYRRAVLEGDPRSFFREPPEGVEVTTYDPRWGFFVPEDGTVEGLKFQSPYEPFHKGMQEAFDGYRNNRTARARYWRHNDGPRPTLLAIHGFMADPYWLNERFFSLQSFYEQGYDIALFTLPHHGLRAESGSFYSGQGFFSEGLSGVNEAMGQAICDLRVFLRYLREERGVEKVGVTGVSLGGWTTALLASIDDNIEFAIPNVPVVSPVDLILEWPPAGLLIRAGLFLSQWSVKNMREVLAVTTPLTYQPRLDPERLMIIGGVGDRLAPPKHSRLLWDHWGRCQIHWFPGNHILHLDRGDYLDHMSSFMEKLDFLGEPTVASGARHLNSVPA